ncbi:hypothetical protein Tco_0653820 [Tanacetum coccineum]|uniref:Uncharacterized protein n=1 Tax=Tanacetum coccineum TaxID=301880 RepID=A0ABQ4X1H4_9ASTR
MVHQIIDFLEIEVTLCYALNKEARFLCFHYDLKTIFWRSAEATTYDNGEVQIAAIIDDVSEPSTSPSRITSSPSHSPEPSPSPAPSFEHSPDHTTAAALQPSPTQPSPHNHHTTQPSPTQPSPTQPSTRAEHHFSNNPMTHLPCCAHHMANDEGSLKLNDFDEFLIWEDDSSKQGKEIHPDVRKNDEEKRTRKARKKAIMLESEPKKKSKKEIEQERLSFAEAIRLEEQMNEEQRAQIARDEEIARQWDEEERQRAMSEAKSTKKIDWNDPSVIRPIFEKVWDFNQHIEPMEHGSEKMKSPKKIEEEDADTQKEMKEVVKESRAKRKKSLPKKEGLIRDRKDVESLSTKYPIVDWKTYTLTEKFSKELDILVKERSVLQDRKIDLKLGKSVTLYLSRIEEDEIWKESA